MPYTTQLFRSSFEGNGELSEVLSERHVWRFHEIRKGLKRRCKKVNEDKSFDQDGKRLVEATDRTSDFKFVALMEHNEKPNTLWPSSYRGQIVQMYYVAGFAGRSGLVVSESAAKFLHEQTQVSTVIVDEGILYVIAEPLFIVEFDIDFFLGQLDLYLADVRMVGNYLYG